MRLLISAGEPSGDLYAAELVRHLRRDVPELSAFGLGGDRLAAQQVELLAHVRDLAVVGLAEVIRHLGYLRRVFRQTLAAAEEQRPDLAVLVDYAGFNLRLARALRRRGVPVVYYVSPQVWAWRRRRVRTIRQAVSRMLVIFPFEEAFYGEAGVPCRFVGHPLVDLVQPASEPGRFLESLGLDPSRPVVTVLPGSRSQEVRYNLEPLAGGVRQLAERRPDLQFLLAVAPSLDPEWVRGLLGGAPMALVSGQTNAALGAARLALVASGTATVETALLDVPMVVVYRISGLSYALGKPFVRLPHYSMVNLIAGREVVPEIIQKQLTAERVAREALLLLEDETRARTMRAGLAEVREALGGPGASARAAEAVLEELRARSLLRPRTEC